MGNLFKKSKNKETFKNSVKVCAIFDFNSGNSEELSFKKNDILFANEKPLRLWWFAKHSKTKKSGYIPRNYVVEYEHCYKFLPAWHDITDIEANRRLLKPDQPIGTFIIRPDENKHQLVLSIKSEESKPVVKHYKINNDVGQYSIYRNKKFTSLVKLIKYYNEIQDELCCNLSKPYSNEERPTLQFRRLEVDRTSFEVIRRIGRGHFSEVFMAKYRQNDVLVAVKILHQYHDDRKAFIKEAKLMHSLHHERIVKLLGVCTIPTIEPMFIITEFMEHGSLLDYLKNREVHRVKSVDKITMLMEIAEGMEYLESRSFIHRDLRAANILVGKDKSVKVADFGLASIVEDMYIAGEDDYEFPVRWMAQEVLLDNKFNLKSDVWSFGILMYEVLTNGKLPYPEMTNRQVAIEVRDGYIMPKPTGSNIKCSDRFYNTMKSCWAKHRERPSFQDLFNIFKDWANIKPEICS